jgi:lactate permease
VIAALAVVPIVVVLVLMAGLRWSAARAGVVGLAVTLAVAWLALRAQPGPLGFGAVTLGSLAEAGFTAATILWIILPALAIHRLQVRTGAVATLRRAIAGLSPDPGLVGLLVAWFFALVLEGAAGFGTAAALAAPFLASLGFSPVTAVTAALVGHSVGVSFGAVGTPIVPQVAATGLEPLALSRATAVYPGVLGVLIALAVVWVLGSSERADLRRLAGWAVVAAAAFLIPFLALAWWVGPELPTLGGAVLGGGLFVGILVLRRRREAIPGRADPAPGPIDALRAAAPYVILLLLVLGTRLIPSIEETTTGVAWSWSLWDRSFSGTFLPLHHPGTLLAASLFLAAAWRRAPRVEVAGALREAVRILAPVVVALVTMLGLARLLVHSGMIQALAEAAAGGMGAAWPVVAPGVGAVGTFVTGSATASNALLTDLQAATAEGAGLPVLPVLGAQGFGAAVGNLIAPHNLVAAAAVVGLTGRESEVLRRTLPVALPYAAAGGVLALVLTRLG